MNLPRMILASASPRRSELLHEIGVEFQVLPAHAEEIHPEHLTPHEICQVNAYRKARSVAKKVPDAMVLGADTLVCLGTNVFGKPKDLKEAHSMLSKLQGRTHEVVTGVCLIHLRNHRQKVFAESTTVTFRTLHSGQIRRYLSKVDPLDKAGAYAIQGMASRFVMRIEGSYSNVVGLPVAAVYELLRQLNLQV